MAGDYGPGLLSTERGSPVRALAKVDVTLREPEVDAERVELVYPGAVTGSAIWDLAAQDRMAFHDRSSSQA